MTLLYEWITKLNMKGAMEAFVPMNEMAEAMTTMLWWRGGDGAISADPRVALEAALSFSYFFFLVCSLVDSFLVTWRAILGLWDVSHLEESECILTCRNFYPDLGFGSISLLWSIWLFVSTMSPWRQGCCGDPETDRSLLAAHRWSMQEEDGSDILTNMCFVF